MIKEIENLSEYLIKSDSEIKKYIQDAVDNKLSTTIIVYDKNNQIEQIKFYTYLFLSNSKHLEIEYSLKDSEKNIIENTYLIGIFYVNGVKIIFETEIQYIEDNDKAISVLRLKQPKLMYRIQRRNSYRVKTIHNSKLKIDLDTKNEDYKNLSIIDISAGGAGVIVSLTDNQIKKLRDFETTTIYLPEILNNEKITIKSKICHIKDIKEEFLPEDIKIKYKGKNFKKVGIQFELNSGIERTLTMLVNYLSKPGN